MAEDISKYFFDDDDEVQKKHDPYKPRWPHSELPLAGGTYHKNKGKRSPGQFVMQYKEFDIYVYPNTFMLRWGEKFYCKHHAYQTIKEPIDGQWALPVEVQTAILAARTMLLGEFT